MKQKPRKQICIPLIRKGGPDVSIIMSTMHPSTVNQNTANKQYCTIRISIERVRTRCQYPSTHILFEFRAKYVSVEIRHYLTRKQPIYANEKKTWKTIKKQYRIRSISWKQQSISHSTCRYRLVYEEASKDWDEYTI